MTSGNYLAFAIANRWIQYLTYVYPEDPAPAPVIEVETIYDRIRRFSGMPPDDDDDGCPVNDLMTMYFRDEDWKTKIIELKHYPKDIDVFRTELPTPVTTEAAS